MADNGIIGIDVINNVSDLVDFSESDIVAPEVGQNLFDFFSDYAAKRQVFLITDGQGNIIINRDTTETVATKLLHRVGIGQQNTTNNILSCDWSYDDSKRYNTYRILSQDNVAATAENSNADVSDADIGKMAGVKGVAVDEAIRTSRLFVATGEKPLNEKECEERAKWQLSVKRARSFSYSATVDKHSHADDIWRPNRLVKVSDQRVGVDGEYLINEIEYRSDNTQGNTTRIGIVDKNKYSLIAQEGAFKQQTTKQGEEIVLDCSKLKGVFLETGKKLGFCK